MKSSALFLISIALLSVSFCIKDDPNTLDNSPQPPTAFNLVTTLLANFKQSILDEQAAADVRFQEEEAWCTDSINQSQAIVDSRQKDVDDLTAHIAYLNNAVSEYQTDVQTRVDRLQANADLLAKFKQERCDSNLVFVKNLREHMEAIDILTLLKGDINEYFESKSLLQTGSTAPTEFIQKKTLKAKAFKINKAFIQRFAEFSHLLNKEKVQVFLQLQQEVQNLTGDDATAVIAKNDETIAGASERTDEEIGTGHIDNDKGELKKLDTPDFELSADFNLKVQAKILAMIDNLIQHLKDSRNEITRNEIQAAEDFAIFQTNLEKENEHLEETIEDLKVKILATQDEINVSNDQLSKRQDLLVDAQKNLANLKEICLEKEDYYNSETTRRSGEEKVVDTATELFNNLTASISDRVRQRTEAAAAGKDLGNNLDTRVVNDESNVASTVAEGGNVASVVF